MAVIADAVTKHDFQGVGAELFIMRCKHCRLSLTNPLEIRRLQGEPCKEIREQMEWNTGANGMEYGSTNDLLASLLIAGVIVVGFAIMWFIDRRRK